MAPESCGKMYAILISLFLVIAKILAEPEAKGDYLRREHSLMRPYQGSGMTIPNWDFYGSTFVSSNYIRLTSDHQSKTGALWNSVPNNLLEWEMVVHFAVHGQGTTLFGDGFSFWYARDRFMEGPAFGSTAQFYGLGVFFDTYDNHNGEHSHEHPYISAMIGNGSVEYDHDRDGTHSQVEGCSAQFRAKQHDTMALIRYSTSQERLTVLLDVDGKNEWRECFDVGGVKLPTGLYWGVSAATGQLADNHDVISMKLYEVDMPVIKRTTEDKVEDKPAVDYSKIVPHAQGAEAYRDRIEDLQGSFSSRTTKIFSWLFWLALFACVCIGVGLYFYQKQQIDAKKRFY